VQPVEWFDRDRYLNFVPNSFLRSAWFAGGWNQFAPPREWNLALAALAGICLAASGLAFVRRRARTGENLDGRVGLILFGFALAGATAVLIIAKSTTQASGRIAYTGLAGFAILAVLGLDELAARLVPLARARPIILAVWPALLLILNVYAFVHFVIPFRGL
jgi:hypothetical protein